MQVMAYAAAVREAQRAGLDLLSVAPGAAPPVFKLGHADAAAFAARQREKETRKKEVERRRRDTLKEVRHALCSHQYCMVAVLHSWHGGPALAAACAGSICFTEYTVCHTEACGLFGPHPNVSGVVCIKYSSRWVTTSKTMVKRRLHGMHEPVPCHAQVRVGPKTAENDLQMKLRQARGFIDKVCAGPIPCFVPSC